MLEEIKTEQSANALVGVLRNYGDSFVREEAAKALEDIDANNPRALAEGLRHAMESETLPPAARARAIGHVGFYFDGDALLETLKKIAANNPSDEIRTTAQNAARQYKNNLDLLAAVRDAGSLP